MKKLIFFSTLFLSPTLWAESYYQQQWQLTPTASYEANSLGAFSNVGLKWAAYSGQNQYVELVTQLSNFQPSDKLHPDTTFTNLDAAVRFGIFNQINLYVELGIALDELLVDDGTREYYYGDDYGYDYNYDYDRNSSRPDWFVGLGGGWRADWLSVNLYARCRYLESLEEEFLQHNFNPNQAVPDRYQWFTGVELSIHF